MTNDNEGAHTHDPEAEAPEAAAPKAAASRRSKSQDATPKARGSSADVGQKEVTEAFDEANEQGYFGTTQDETPNENYTVAGVTAGKPTPETESKGERRAIPDADARDRK